MNTSVYPERAGAGTWLDRAACVGSDPDWWFPGRGGDVTRAKAICATCTTREECLQYALDNFEEVGIWGGLTKIERRVAARERKAA